MTTILSINLSKRVPIATVSVQPLGSNAIDARLLMDFGTAQLGAVLSPHFVSAYDGFGALPSVEMPPTVGMGQSGLGRLTRLERIRVAGLVAHNPIVALMRETSGFFAVSWADSTLGAPILSRTRLFIDYSRSRILIEPSANFDAPFEFDASGLSLRARPQSVVRSLRTCSA